MPPSAAPKNAQNYRREPTQLPVARPEEPVVPSVSAAVQGFSMKGYR